MLAIARALNRADVRTRGDIIFIGTVQEELGLIGMDYWLENNPGVADVLIALDGGLPNVNYGALGIYWTRYFFRGAGSHTNTSAGKPHPARALADAIHSIYEIEIPEGHGGAVYNVGMLDGGKIFNAIPEEVSFTMDLRSVNPILLDMLDREIEARVVAAAEVTASNGRRTRSPATAPAARPRCCANGASTRSSRPRSTRTHTSASRAAPSPAARPMRTWAWSAAFRPSRSADPSVGDQHLAAHAGPRATWLRRRQFTAWSPSSGSALHAAAWNASWWASARRRSWSRSAPAGCASAHTGRATSWPAR
jgi:hypothetical protein